MRRCFLLLVFAGLVGAWSAQAVAGGPPSMPGITSTLPVTLPSVTVPTVTVPAVTVPTVTVPTVTVPSPAGGSGGSGGSTSGSSGLPLQLGGSSSRSSSTRAGHGRPRVQHFRAHPKKFKNDPRARHHRGTKLKFWLSRGAIVTFFVREEAPECRDWGSFTAAGRRGFNTIPFLGVVGAHRLPPGTYTITAVARIAGKHSIARSATFVIVAYGTSLDSASAESSRCTSSAGAAALQAHEAGSGASGSPGGRPGANRPRAGSVGALHATAAVIPGPEEGGKPVGPGGLLGIEPPFHAPAWTQWLVIGALALGGLMLALSLFAPGPLRYRRAELALVGLMIVVVFAIAALLS